MRLQATVSTAATGGAAGFGGGISLYAETATDATNQQQAQIVAVWTDATNATRKAKLQLSAYDTAERLGIEVSADGTYPIITTYGGQVRPYVAKTSNYTLTRGDYVVECTTGAFTITLPTAVGCTGQIYYVKSQSTGLITIATTSSQLVDNYTSGVFTLVQYESITVMSNGTNWIIL
jgi:hypothetical protein